MIHLWKLISEESLQYGVFISLSLLVFFLTGIIYLSNSGSFQRFFGSIHPLVVVFVVIILGLVALSFLLSVSQFAIYKPGNLKGILLASGLAVLIAVVMILVDRRVVLPADINIPLPESLIFYPVMGYVAEILFHVVPLSLLYFLLRALFGGMSSARIIWISILIASSIEPIFQTAFSSGQNPIWAVVYIALHIFLLNLIQLVLFRRYDFVTMYSFRLTYYLLWHIAWGHIRLSLLF